jgi:hypothetical protein
MLTLEPASIVATLGAPVAHRVSREGLRNINAGSCLPLQGLQAGNFLRSF